MNIFDLSRDSVFSILHSDTLIFKGKDKVSFELKTKAKTRLPSFKIDILRAFIKTYPLISVILCE
jgi:hypothetical protein